MAFTITETNTAKQGEALLGDRPLQGRLHRLELMISGRWNLLQEEGSQQLRLLNRLPPEIGEWHLGTWLDNQAVFDTIKRPY